MDKVKYQFLFFVGLLLFGCVTNNTGNSNSNLKIKTTSQGILIGNSTSELNLFIPSRTLKTVNERSGGGQNNRNYFYFLDTRVNSINVDLHFSGWFEPIEKFRFKEAEEYWAYEYRNTSEFLNPEFRKTGNWEVFLYDVPLPEMFQNACSANMRANLIQDDIWLDLHLSITDMKTGEFLHNVLFEYLKTVHIIKQ